MHDRSDDGSISLHDCRAEKVEFHNGVLTFVFPNGFWVAPQQPDGKSVRTGSSQVDFQIMDGAICGVEIYVFKKKRNGNAIREEWDPVQFINAVNAGAFQVEFITQYQSFQSILFKCWIWFDRSPYHHECEIILNAGSMMYHWDNQCRTLSL